MCDNLCVRTRSAAQIATEVVIIGILSALTHILQMMPKLIKMTITNIVQGMYIFGTSEISSRIAIPTLCRSLNARSVNTF